MSGIFINYRRSDSVEYAKRVANHLRKQFGNAQVFIDVNTLEPGEKFKPEIRKVLGQCDFFITIIGKTWLTVKEDGTNSRRIDMASDLLRQELEFALDNHLDIIPVLVDGAALPKKDDLPKSIQELLDFNKIDITSKTGTAQIEQIAKRINKVRNAREQKRQEVENALIELAGKNNHHFRFGDMEIMKLSESRYQEYIRCAIWAGEYILSANLADFVSLGVTIEPMGTRKPFSIYAFIEWPIKEDKSHIPTIIEDLIAFAKLTGEPAFERFPIVVEHMYFD